MPAPQSHARPLVVTATVADLLVSELASHGIDTYFGVPGGAIEPLFDALARQQRAGRIRLVPMRSEAAAGFAADGYFRETGKPAVCTGTTGPGISNLLTAVMNAHADRVPILVLTPQVALHKQGRGALQDSSMDGHDLSKIFEECTLYSSSVTSARQLPTKLARALSLSAGSPRGPVHISIASDILASKTCERSLGLNLSSTAPVRAVDAAALDALIEGLCAARSPVFYVGDDAGPDAPRLFSVAKLLGAAVVSSPAGKRWVGHFEPAYRGAVGFSGNPAAAEALTNADLVIAFGATFDELSTNAWTVFPDSPIWSVDQHFCHAYRLPGAVPVIASVGDVVDRILSIELRQLARRPIPIFSSPPPCEGSAFSTEIAARPLAGSAQGPVHPADLMHFLSRELPMDVVIHVDAGNGFSWSTRDLRRLLPNTYRVAMGLSTMCWGIGAVIGAAVARGRRALCITGDGSMLMSSLELTVAAEQHLPVTYIVLNDSALGMVRHGQLLSGAESVAHAIRPVRFDRLAEACGVPGVRVERYADLERICRDWLRSDDAGPSVIDVRIDRDAVPPIGDRVQGLAAGVTR